MKENKGSKTNDVSAIERRKLKKAAQQQSGDKVSERIFAEVANKSTFGPPWMSHVAGKQIGGNGRLVPLAILTDWRRR